MTPYASSSIGESSFASTSRPPTYLARAPDLTPKPRISSTLSNPTHTDSRRSSHAVTTRRKGPRKSAFDDFDEINFCNDLASRIASELAARPKQSVRRTVPIDPWRGSPYVEPSSSRPRQGLEDCAVQTDGDIDMHEDGGDDDEEEEMDLQPERTERTKAAAEAFLKRLAERQGDQPDDAERHLEKEVFAIFGEPQSGQADIVATQTPDGQDDISPEVAAHIAQLLHKPSEEAGRPSLIHEMEVDASKANGSSSMLDDSSIEYDQLMSSSNDAAHQPHPSHLEGIEGSGEDGSDGEEDSGEEDEDEDENGDESEDGVSDSEDEDEKEEEEEEEHEEVFEGEKYEGPQHLDFIGANQDQAISLSDSDDDDRIRSGPDMDSERDMEAQHVGHGEHGINGDEEDDELLEEIDQQASRSLDTDGLPPFEPSFSVPAPSQDLHQWNTSSHLPAEHAAQLQASVFSPNMFDQPFSASFNQEAAGFAPSQQDWAAIAASMASSVPPSPSAAPPPPVASELQAAANGEDLVHLKEKVNVQERQKSEQKSHRTSLSPVAPSSVATFSQSTAQPTAADQVQRASDLINLKDVILKNATQSTSTSVANDVGTPKTERRYEVDSIVEEDEEREETAEVELEAQDGGPNGMDFARWSAVVDEPIAGEIEISEVQANDTASEAGTQPLPAIKSVASLAAEDMLSQDVFESLQEDIQEVQRGTEDSGHVAISILPTSIERALSVEQAPVANLAEVEENSRPVEKTVEESPSTPARRTTRSMRGASEALSTNEDVERRSDGHSSARRPRQHPRHSDPDNDLADFVPEGERRAVARYRSRTRTPSVSRNAGVAVPPTSIGIRDELLDTSILEEDDEADEVNKEAAAPSSPTPAPRKRSRRSNTKQQGDDEGKDAMLASADPVDEEKQALTVEQPAEQIHQVASSNGIEPSSSKGERSADAEDEERRRQQKKERKKVYDRKRRDMLRKSSKSASSETSGNGSVADAATEHVEEPTERTKAIKKQAKENAEKEVTDPAKAMINETVEKNRPTTEPAESIESRAMNGTMGELPEEATERADKKAKGEAKKETKRKSRKDAKQEVTDLSQIVPEQGDEAGDVADQPNSDGVKTRSRRRTRKQTEEAEKEQAAAEEQAEEAEQAAPEEQPAAAKRPRRNASSSRLRSS